MAGWTVCKLDEAENVFEGNYPGDMRFLTEPIEAQQVAITYRRMPRHTGGKGSYGHYHKTQEEIYFVFSGRLQFKLDDEVVEVVGPSAVRVAPEVARSIWNDHREDGHLLIVSTKIADPEDAVQVPNFWPA